MVIDTANNVGIGTTMLVIIVFFYHHIMLLEVVNFLEKNIIGEIIAGMEIENTTFNGAGNQWSQKLHFHTHAFGSAPARRMTISEGGGKYGKFSLIRALTLPVDTVAIASGGNGIIL
jgi:hypothetical protein